jgi:tetratricopeptide (TPR) repeat protein
VLALVVASGAGLFFLFRPRLPEPGSDIYERFTRAFYHGLAAMQVGLLDDARVQLTTATEAVPDEAAAWANLALAHMRLGDLVAAEAPLARARELAPDDTAILLMAGRMETARGRLDEGIALLRQAAQREQDGIRARVALAEELERAGGESAENEALRVLDEALERSPANLFLIVERARIAARRGDAARLNDSLGRMKPFTPAWPPIAVEQYENLQRAATAGSLPDTSRASNLLRNVLARVPAFVESLSAVRTPAELIAEPIERYIALAAPPSTPAPPDMTLQYTGGAPIARGPDTLLDSVPSVLLVDWNHDFELDSVTFTDGRLRLLVRTPSGLVDQTPADAPGDVVQAWAADVEMDGDLDLVLGVRAGDPVVLRNNGDGTARRMTPFAGVSGARGFAWADLDRDADPDAALIDAAGTLQVFENRQAGSFSRVEVPGLGPLAALSIADLDADGSFDIVALESAGSVKRVSDLRDVSPVADWQGMPTAVPGAARVLTADLDNNGAVDVLATAGADSRIWLAGESYGFQALPQSPRADVLAIRDDNGDGVLDLVVAGAIFSGRASAKYHWKTIQPRAQQNAGDQRINSFGIGGEIEARSGLLVQKQVITGPVVHIGLGTRQVIDVVRILWPNGVPQAEFGEEVDDELVAEQRLKGSCPWVFAWDGTRMSFVTDFLWRSPLGLRINAQDTAGVVQTEDWVKIGGGQLVPKDGSYDVRITAELWETHYFDHVSLMVVDHPEDTDVWVDERFSAASPPALNVYAFRGLKPVDGAWDDSGRNVTSLVETFDGQYLDTFERGRYQGIARYHAVEFVVDELADPARQLSLVARGWIYPTDSSINVAVGQGTETAPSGLALDAMDAQGQWYEIRPDIGFPAGKNKTILVSLAGLAGARRLRLRTNLEIYWDQLAVATPAGAEPRTTRLAASRADLRFRGFSQTVSPRGKTPETPLYNIVESRSQRWRDLTGYHTRFGDVRELLQGVDDRYVIMNAGDEMQLLFPEQPAPAAGWRRDFVLIGDGWEKDGDYNTGHSQTVLPLPSHDTPAYGSADTTLELEDDPVYRRHRGDWERFHTRYVTPRAFIRGLRR